MSIWTCELLANYILYVILYSLILKIISFRCSANNINWRFIVRIVQCMAPNVSGETFVYLLNKYSVLCLLGRYHLDIWVKRDQLDVTCFIISLFNAQHVSDVNTSILRSLRLICWVISWVILIWFDVCWYYVVVWLWWCGTRMQAEALNTSRNPLTLIEN